MRSLIRPGIFILFLVYLGSVLATEWPELKLTDIPKSELPVSVQVSILKDPVYKTKKVYQAYPLTHFLETLTLQQKAHVSDMLVVFTAKDGYKSFMGYQDAMAESGYVAYKDQKANENNTWETFKFGAEIITPAPFYLVWPKSELDEWRFPWPFQLVSIALQPASDFFGDAAPKTAQANIQQGFSLFSRYCIRCHTVNNVGGKIGPVIKISNSDSVNRQNFLLDFILDAPAYSKETKMPAFKKLLSRENAVSIIDYLKHMNTQ